MIESISVEKLILDPRTQIRARTDERVVAQYAEVVKSGGELPPITVFFDGESYLVADGFLRVAAWKRCGLELVPCDVREGSRRDAILFAVGANATHGLPRSNADKRRAVLAVLGDPEWSGNTDRWVAEACAVSHTFVRRVRAALARGNAQEENDPSTSNADGSCDEKSHSSEPTGGIGFQLNRDSLDDDAGTDKELVEPSPVAEPSSGGIGFHRDDAVHPKAGAASNRSADGEAFENEPEQHTGHVEDEADAELESSFAENQSPSARSMRRGRDGKLYPVRLGPSIVAVAEPSVAKKASDVQRDALAGSVLDPLLRLLGDRIAGASLYSLEQFAMLSPVDQLAVLTFLVGGRTETLDEAIRIDRSPEVNAAIEGERAPAKASGEVAAIDPSGREIPAHVAPAMAEVPVLSALLTDVQRARRRWNGLVTRYQTNMVPRMSPLLLRAGQDVEQSLRKAERALSGAAIPHAVCGYCKARGNCEVCRGAGWLGKEAHASVPRPVSSSPLTAEEMGWWLGSNRRTGT